MGRIYLVVTHIADPGFGDIASHMASSLDRVLTAAGHRRLSQEEAEEPDVVLGFRSASLSVEPESEVAIPEVSIQRVSDAEWRYDLVGRLWKPQERSRTVSTEALPSVILALFERLEVEPGFGVDDQLRMDVETFVSLWRAIADDLPLHVADRRTSEALVAMASEVTQTDAPPRRVLREAFRWFAYKADMFAEEAAKAGGKAFGVAVGGTGGVVVTGQLPRLTEAIARVLSHLP